MPGVVASYVAAQQHAHTLHLENAVGRLQDDYGIENTPQLRDQLTQLATQFQAENPALTTEQSYQHATLQVAKGEQFQVDHASTISTWQPPTALDKEVTQLAASPDDRIAAYQASSPYANMTMEQRIQAYVASLDQSSDVTLDQNYGMSYD